MGTTCLIGFRRPLITVLTCRIGSSSCHIENGQMTRTQNSSKPQFLMMISPIFSHVSLSGPQLYHHLRTQSDDNPLYLSMPWTWVNAEYNIHRELHHSMIGPLLLPASLSSLGRPCCTHLSKFPRSWVWRIDRVSAPGCAFLPIYRLQIDQLHVIFHIWLFMAYPCISELAWSQPPSSHDLWPPNSFKPGFQLHLPAHSIFGLQGNLQTPLITASKFGQWMASQLVPSRRPTASVSARNLGRFVHLQRRSITASKCISQFTRSSVFNCITKLPPLRPPSSLNDMASKLVRSWLPSASLSSLDFGLFVHLQTRSITASKGISQFTRSRPPSAFRSSLDHSLLVHLQVHTTMASQCISKFSQWSFPGATLITLRTRLQPRLAVCIYIERLR